MTSAFTTFSSWIEIFPSKKKGTTLFEWEKLCYLRASWVILALKKKQTFYSQYFICITLHITQCSKSYKNKRHRPTTNFFSGVSFISLVENSYLPKKILCETIFIFLHKMRNRKIFNIISMVVFFNFSGD
jgi:hypothetical protein